MSSFWRCIVRETWHGRPAREHTRRIGVPHHSSVDTLIRRPLSSARSLAKIRVMTASAIKRVGVVVKPHQPDALETLCRLTTWLAERRIALVGLPDIDREQIEHQT